MNGFELSIDVQSLKNAEQHLKSMVTYSEQLEKNLKNAINAVGSGNAKFLENLTGRLKEVQNTTVNIKTDTASLDKAATIIDRIVQDAAKLSGKPIFDPNALYTTTKSAAEVEKQIGDLKTKLATVDEDTKNTFQAPIPYREQSETYQKVLQEKIAIERAALENSIKIEEQKLQWAKMTVGERLAAEESHRKKMAAAEKKANDEVKNDYKKTTNEIINIMKTRDKLVNSGNAKPDQIKSLEAQFSQLNQHRLNLEAQYGAQVVNIAQQAQRKVWEMESKRIDDAKKKEQERLDSKRSTTSGAINFARSAVSVNELKQAKGYLEAAMGNEIDDKRLEKLRDAYTRVRIAIEEKTRSQKNETTLQPTVANEYARLLKEMDKVKKKQEELAKTQTYKSGNTQAQGDMSALVAREQDLQKRIQAIRTAAGGQLAEIDRKHAAETAAANLATYQQTEQKKIEIARQQYQKRLEESKKYGTVSTQYATRLVTAADKSQNAAQSEKYIRQMEEAKRRLNKTDSDYAKTLKLLDDAIARHTRNIKMATDAQYRKNEAEKQAFRTGAGSQRAVNQAIDSSHLAGSIEQQIAAIKRLKQVRDSLNKHVMGESHYNRALKEINKELQRQQQNVDKLTNKHKQLGQQQSVLSRGAQQLQMRLASVFGVAAIKGYINHLVQVRKTFELQHKSMQIILQDKDKADEIWNQTIQLATKSPFRISQLVNYTKQLAAYRIETDKLHDTTKRLADISAGVGVDMQRLILAYGQVRAAEYLRGTELRQFTEAGIPLLDELARYFTEIEGKTVSTAKVFDMISKRMVAFADVEAVIQKMTNEGGVFYKMQEQQAQTLHGLISNMHDQIDLMLNSIGSSHDGFMKSAVQSVTKLIKNWRDVGLAIEILLPQLGLVLLAQKAITLSMNEQKMAMMANIKFQNVWNALLLIGRNIFMSMGVGAVVAGVTMLIVELTRAAREAARLRDELGAIDTEVTKDFKEAVDTYKRLADAANDATKSYAEQKEALESLHRQFAGILPDRMLEIEYLKKTANGYDEATEALKRHYNAKSIEKKKAKVEEVVGGKISEYVERFDEDSFFYVGQQGKKQSFADKYGVEALEVQQLVTQVVDEVKRGETELDNFMSRLIGRFAEFYSIPIEEAKKIRILGNSEFHLVFSELKKYITQVNAITGTFFDTKAEKTMEGIYSQQKKGYNELIEKTKEYKRALEALKKARENAKRDGIIKGTEQLEIDAATQSVHNLYIELKRLAGFTDSGIFTNAQLSNITDSQMGVEDEFVRVTELVSKKFKQAFQNNTLTEQLKEDIDNAIAAMKDSDFETVAKDLTRKIAEKFDVPLYKFDKFLGAFGKGREHSVKEVKTAIDETEKLIKAYDTALAKLPIYALSVEAVEATMVKEFGFGEEGRKELVRELKVLKELYPAIGGLQEQSNSGGTPKDWMAEVVKLVRDAHKEYEELNDTLTHTESKLLTIDKYSKAFANAIKNVPELKGLGLKFEDIDFTTEESTIETLESFLKKFPETAGKRGQQARQKILEAIKDIRGEVQIRLAKDADQRLFDEIDKMFNDYEVSKDLTEIGMPDEMQSYYFDVDTSSLSEIREKVEKEIAAINNSDAATKGQEDRLKKLQEFLKKVTELENKEQGERAKKYYEYTKKMMSESARLKVEELKTIAGIERAFAPNKNDTQAEREMKENAKKSALEGLKKQTDTELAKNQWTSFKESDMFVSIMGDLQMTSKTAISALIQQIENYKKSWSNLPLDQMDEVVKQLEKLRDAQYELDATKNPFATARATRRDIEKDGRSEQQAQEDMVSSQAALENLKQRQILLESIENAEYKGLDATKLREEYQNKYNVNLNDGLNALNNQKSLVNGMVESQQQTFNTSKNQVNNYKKLHKAEEKQADALQKTFGLAKDLYGAFKNLYSALGGDEDSPAAIFGDMAFQMVECVMNTVMLTLQIKAASKEAIIFGAAMKSAMGIIGWIVMAIELIAMGLTAAFKVHDQKIEKQIEREREKVEKLEKAYEKLEQVVEDAYNVSTLETASIEATKNIEDQIKARERMIALEKDKKNTDDDKIKEWREEIESLSEQRAELEKNLVSTATSGIVDNVRDVSRSFTDAWLEAFQEVGDGISGLEEEFMDMMKELVLQQAAMTVVSPFIEKLKQDVEKAVGGDYAVSTAELKGIIDNFTSDMPVMSQLLEDLMNSWKAAGLDITSAGGELGGLQAGISGITEDQADILAAYWSSVRFMVSNIDTTLTKMAEHTLSMAAQNPIVEQLKLIVAQVGSINSLLDSLLTPHPTQAGYGLKVVL